MAVSQQLIYVTPLGLMITDGTTAGTYLISATTPGFAPLGRIASLGGKAVFVGSSALAYNELWTTDGSDAGTYLITTLPASSGYANLIGLTAVNGHAVFDYTDGANPGYGYGMWVTDGTAAGTMPVSSGLFGSFDPGSDAALGNDLIFSATGGLAITDGTTSGTDLVTPAEPNGFTVGDSMATLGTSVMFTATSNPVGRDTLAFNELWITNGTASGTSRVVTLADNTGGGLKEARISNLTPLGSKVLFDYDDGIGNEGLWVTDGTASGTIELPGIDFPRIGVENAVGGSRGALAGNLYVFTSVDGLDVTDGTIAGTSVLIPDTNGPNGFIPYALMAGLGNAVVFAATTSGTEPSAGPPNELWITDGTAAGTKLIMTFPVSGLAGIFSLGVLGDKVLFSYYDGTGDELWATDGTTTGTMMISSTGANLTAGETAPIITTTPIACFLAGTRIATKRGWVRVERLRVGDFVRTISGPTQPIEWIGRRRLDCRRHPTPERVKPVRISAHAFGENRPERALLLSPDHSVFTDGVLIPIKFLINDETILQIDVATATYYHLELPRHDVVLAEGLPTESYLETGGRSAFEDEAGPFQLYPDFAPDERRVAMVWETFGYAPLVGSDEQLARVRTRLAVQARMLAKEPANLPDANRNAG